jgi:hypothetical protein
LDLDRHTCGQNRSVRWRRLAHLARWLPLWDCASRGHVHGSGGAAEWENGTLDRFLDGFAAFADTRVVDVPQHQQELASWRLFADMVRAATGYE